MNAPARSASSAASGVRRAEIFAALSLATDLAMGQPVEFALRACVLALRLADALGFAGEELSAIYYQALLRYIGCNAESYTLSALFGDELRLRRDFAVVDSGHAPEVLRLVFQHLKRANAEAPPLQMAWAVAKGLIAGQSVAAANFAGHCEVAQRLAERLGFGSAVIRALGQLYERWDGRGLPQGLKGEAIAPAVRVVTLAQDVMAMRDAKGPDAAVAMVRQRRAKAYDPRMADRFCARAEALLRGLDDQPSWDAVLALEPEPHVLLSEAQLDEACIAIADFADIKSPFTLGHSRAVGALAGEAARRCGLAEADIVAVRRAGLLHDVGQVAISAGIWTKPGPLSDSEWERVRLHTYYAERILARPAALARLGAITAHHHERLDGSGYHRAARAAALSPASRILAAVDAYQAMTEPRPHRAALSRDAAAATLRREVRAGRFDGEAAAAVLAAAGHRSAPVRRQLTAGLTEREVEVLRLIARGQSMKQIAAQLGITAKTVDNHIQHLYGKIEVSTRAGATLFAVEQGLLRDGDP